MSREIPPSRPGDIIPDASGWGVVSLFLAMGLATLILTARLLRLV